MDNKLQREIEKAVKGVYEDVKARRVTDMSVNSSEGAATKAMHCLIENHSRVGTGLPNDPAPSGSAVTSGLPNRVALLYLETLLLARRDADGSPLWRR
jgi:hypothetical protein